MYTLMCMVYKLIVTCASGIHAFDRVYPVRQVCTLYVVLSVYNIYIRVYAVVFRVYIHVFAFYVYVNV